MHENTRNLNGLGYFLFKDFFYSPFFHINLLFYYGVVAVPLTKLKVILRLEMRAV